MEKEKPSLSGFNKKSIEERITLVRNLVPELTDGDILSFENGLTLAQADSMVENVIGRYELPYSIATNFIVDGREILIPLVTEESSVVAGISKAAKVFATSGGFTTESDPPLLMGQIQIMAKEIDLETIGESIEINRESLVKLGNSFVPNLVNRGGGITEISFRSFGKTRVGEMGSVDILVDTAEAMGANLVNKICEGMASEIENLTKGRVGIKILSNLSDRRLTRSFCKIPVNSQYLHPDLAQKIVEAQVFAEEDVYRATTHNKGVLNGIDALAIATGQDFRAIEAGAHAYAARSGKYKPLTNWYIKDKYLIGQIELPMAVGTIGGITKFHKTVETSFKILGVKSSKQLAGIMASVGLAQNFAALLALTSIGIDASHMPLHRRKGSI